MGFFSYCCARCGNPVLSGYATTKGVNDWMEEVVGVHKDGSIVADRYDGYGNDFMFEGASIWHRACWELDGQPTTFIGAAQDAPDQGYFFEDGAYDLPDPRTAKPA